MINDNNQDFVRKAIAETKERARVEAEAKRWEETLWAHGGAMADCISSGLSGMALVQALRHHFPAAKRDEVYLAIGTAVAILQADLTLAEMELAVLRDERRAAA